MISTRGFIGGEETRSRTSHQPGDGLLGQGKHIGGKDPHIERSDDSQDQCEYRSK